MKKVSIDDSSIATNKQKVIPYNKKKRKCLICKRLLSGYTRGKYCNLHLSKGQELEDKKLDKKLYELNKKMKMKRRRNDKQR